jgi:flagellar basal body-associated protein FliL
VKEKTRKRIHLIVLWVLILIFAASGALLYLPGIRGSSSTSATPPPQQQQGPFGY